MSLRYLILVIRLYKIVRVNYDDYLIYCKIDL